MKIKVCNISDSSLFEEKVCAEKAMHFLYNTRLGRAAAWAFVARSAFSRICGIWADSRISAGAVAKFISANNINVEEMLEQPSSFKCFNDFFTRRLRPGSRPVAEPENPKAISFPSDGRHLLIKGAGGDGRFFVKGRSFSLKDFLGNAKLAARYFGGDILISRLSPVDYHRYHYPIGGVIAARKLVNGALYSVSPLALLKRPGILWENKRVLNFIESGEFGMCVFAQVGATNVGSIVNFGKLGDSAVRGAEAGMFKFGGSCVLTIFPPGARITWNKTLEEMGSQGIECYARANSLAGVLS